MSEIIPQIYVSNFYMGGGEGGEIDLFMFTRLILSRTEWHRYG